MIKTCTQNGVTKSQPGTSVSVTTIDGKSILHVSRYYRDLPNRHGGTGAFKSLDCDGMVFDNSDQAFKFALQRGYTRAWFKNETK